MSKAAGTLITTYNAQYVEPRFMPGYRGHVPTMKFDYGETYANHSEKYFQDFRRKSLDTSKTNYCKGGYFPTRYSFNPDIAIGARTRRWDRWLAEPRYTLATVDHDRKTELINFSRKGQAHRENYLDRSGEVHPVQHFKLPTTAEQQFKQHVPFMVLSTRYTDDISIPFSKHIANRQPIVSKVSTLRKQRERAIRDVHFESR